MYSGALPSSHVVSWLPPPVLWWVVHLTQYSGINRRTRFFLRSLNFPLSRKHDTYFVTSFMRCNFHYNGRSRNVAFVLVNRRGMSNMKIIWIIVWLFLYTRLKVVFSRCEDVAKDQNTRHHLAWTENPMYEVCIVHCYTGYLAHGNSRGGERGRSRHQNDCDIIVWNIEKRNVSTNIKSSKQCLTNAKDLTVELRESRLHLLSSD